MRQSRRALFLLLLVGCTHVQLTRSTTHTAGTVMEIQYQMVMDNLALLARDPAALPSQIRIKEGTVQVSDEWGLYNLDVSGGSTTEVGGPRAERTVSEQWGADAICDPLAVKQLQDVYRAALHLPPVPDPNFLRAEQKQQDSKPSGQGGKSDGDNPPIRVDLAHDVPTGWFHIGNEHQVPARARYIGHSGDTCVWVMPQEVDQLSRFTLCVLFITKLGPGEKNPSGGGLMFTR